MKRHDKDFDLPPQAADGLLDHVADARRHQPPARPAPQPVPIPGVEAARLAAERQRLRSMWQATVPAQFVDAKLGDFASCPEHATPAEGCADCDDFATVVTPRLVRFSTCCASEKLNLVLTGTVGAGKTRAGFAAVRAPYAAGTKFHYAPSVELLAALDWKNDTARTSMEQFSQVPILYVDDLGIERANDWAQEQWYTIFNRRWMDGLPTIVTTNLVPDDLRDHLGAGGRTYDRLRDRSVGVRLGGQSRRGTT